MGQGFSRTEEEQINVLNNKLDKLWWGNGMCQKKGFRSILMQDGSMIFCLDIFSNNLSNNIFREKVIDFIYDWYKQTIIGDGLDRENNLSICIKFGKRNVINNVINLHFNPTYACSIIVFISMNKVDINREMIQFKHYYGSYKIYPLDECSICMENECQIMDVGCGHQLYCLNCYLHLVRDNNGFALKECPMCRNSLTQLVYQRSDRELDMIQIPR